MKKAPFIPVIIGSIIALAAMTASAETMRCGSDFIQVGDSAFIVIQKCGEPVSKNQIGYTINDSQKRELVVEEWIYGPQKRYYYIVTVTGGKVSEIRSERE